jgi:DNA primase
MSCWRCGFVRPLDYVQEALHCSREKALSVLREFTTGGGRHVKSRKAGQARVAEKPVGLGPVSRAHLQYLESRGLENPKGVVREWGLLATKESTKGWDWRIVGTVLSAEGETQAYVGRSIAEKPERKYKVTDKEHCAGNPHSFLYGIHKVDPKGTIIIVEGMGKAWNIGPGSVATLGAGWHREQASILKDFKTRVICFDPDEAGREKGQKLAEWLSIYPGDTEIIEGLRTDPDKLKPSEVRHLRKEVGLK